MIRRVLPLIALVVVTNVVMLASIRANRTGEPDATLVLTERELRIERTTDRDSAQKLRLATGTEPWFRLAQDHYDWLTPDKLAALGVSCPPAGEDPKSSISCGLPRRVFVAYENDGPAWQKMLRFLQQQREAVLRAPEAFPGGAENFDLQAKYGTRLISVDASVDAAALRRAYPDRERYLIIPAAVRAWIFYREREPSVVQQLSPAIEPLTTLFIAPAWLRDRLSKLEASDSRLSKEPRYTVTLAVGRHFEPWIVAIDPIDSSARPH